MKKRVFLHIGLPKTGTTTIQTFLRENSSHLESAGYIYPDFESMALSGLKVTHHSPFLTFFLEKAPHRFAILDTDTAREEIPRIFEDFRKSSKHSLVISHESMINAQIKMQDLSEFLSDFDVIIICYLRRMDDWLASFYKWSLNSPNGYVERVEDFQYLKRMSRHNFLERLRVWREIFPNARYEIRSFEREKANLLEDFLSIIELSAPDVLESAHRTESANVSQGNVEVMFLAAVARAAGKGDLFQKAATALRRLKRSGVLLPAVGNDLYVLPFDARQAARRIWNDQQAALSAEFGFEPDVIEILDPVKDKTRHELNPHEMKLMQRHIQKTMPKDDFEEFVAVMPEKFRVNMTRP